MQQNKVSMEESSDISELDNKGWWTSLQIAEEVISVNALLLRPKGTYLSTEEYYMYWHFCWRNDWKSFLFIYFCYLQSCIIVTLKQVQIKVDEMYVWRHVKTARSVLGKWL